jgi:NAD(P)-dependent dehydrogenase (short-subunit alcohol dehydrogenase family)
VPALQAAIARVGQEDGPIRVLVSNAANDDRHKVEDVTVAYWEDRMQVDLRHQFFAAQAVRPQMRAAGGGSIVNFGSISWMAAQAGIPVYTAAKAATHGMTRSFARELGQYNIRVNTVVPGWVMTKRQLDLWVDDAANELIDRSQCLAGRVQPQDIAAMVTFLASDNARMCSAQNYVVDGGWV